MCLGQFLHCCQGKNPAQVKMLSKIKCLYIADQKGLKFFACKAFKRVSVKIPSRPKRKYAVLNVYLGHE